MNLEKLKNLHSQKKADQIVLNANEQGVGYFSANVDFGLVDATITADVAIKFAIYVSDESLKGSQSRHKNCNESAEQIFDYFINNVYKVEPIV